MRERFKDVLPILLMVLITFTRVVTERAAGQQPTSDENRLEFYDDDSPLNALERSGVEIMRLSRGRLAIRFRPWHETRPTDEEIARDRRRREGLLKEAIPILVDTPGIVLLEFWDSTSLSDAQFARFSNLGDLVQLAIDNAAITDATLARVGKLERLRSLSVRRCSITGTGLEKLSSLGNLTELDLSFCTISDDDLEPVAGLKNLRSLALRGTQIGSGSIGILKRLSELRALDIRDTKADQEWVRELQQANSKLKVFK